MAPEFGVRWGLEEALRGAPRRPEVTLEVTQKAQVTLSYLLLVFADYDASNMLGHGCVS